MEGVHYGDKASIDVTLHHDQFCAALNRWVHMVCGS
jgi:hypothetical protein